MSAGEIAAESGFAGCVTSQTSSAAFVEYPSPHHLECTRVSECNLPCVSSLTVPAVQRVAKRESCSGGQWAAVVTLCPTTTDGADQDTTDDGRNATCEIRIHNNRSIILDYTINTWRLDYDHEDYVRFGCVPEGRALLIVGNLCNGASAGFRRIMATCEDDPRLLGRVVRTQGKNISKLMRLFDSNERTISYSGESGVNLSAKSGESRTKSGHIAAQTVTENRQCTNENSNSASEKCVQNTAVVDESSMKDLQSFITNTKVSELNGNAMNSESSSNGKSVSADIPYCRKVTNGGGLWENVNISAKSDSDGLWNSAQNHELEQVSNSMVASTAELNNLIAASRAELSKKKEPSVSDKSNLESYFTSFESSRPGKFQPTSHSENSFLPEDNSQYHNSEIFHPYLSSHYNCDMNEMNFDDEEAMLSDTSSEEDLRPHPSMTNTNYLPAYALHTIIEESCEESERDSRTTTPTNDAVASKLERYFSWDIINDADGKLPKNCDDESTVYSDSLSESSNSISEDVKDIDPTQMASSRLEKYFTSGLVDDQNYFYPDDAEFLDDAPVSDFEEDSIHQKISRSALLSSLETKPVINNQVNVCSKPQEPPNTESNIELPSVQKDIESPVHYHENDADSNSTLDYNCDKEENNSAPTPESTQSLKETVEISERVTIRQNDEQSLIDQSHSKLENECEKILTSDNVESVAEIDSHVPKKEICDKDSEVLLNNSVDKDDVDGNLRPPVNKEQLACDIQAIIKKLLSYFTTGTGSESFKKNIERDYVSAWHILETEIERLLQSISPSANENNSCNSSTIDSNNSDYGSDTIESMECITDDDDVDAKSRINPKCSIVNILSSAYKYQSPESDLGTFNISEETLSIWKRLIQSLQKDNSVLSESKLCDPNAEARLYIRDQIVTLMHTVTLNDNLQDIEKLSPLYTHENNKDLSQSLTEENDFPDQINEAFNVNLSNPNILTHLTDSDTLDEVVPVTKPESSSDEGISDDGAENIIALSKSVIAESESLKNDISNNDSVVSINTDINENPSVVVCDSVSPVDNPCISSPVISDYSLEIEEDCKHTNKHIFSNKESSKKDSDLKFSVIVDIELGEDTTEREPLEMSEDITCEPPEKFQNKDTDCEYNSSPLNNTESDMYSSASTSNENDKNSGTSNKHPVSEVSSRDTGYFSFKSSGDSLLNVSSQSAEFVDVPNFKSLKRTVKKFPISNTLSKSTNNILQTFSSSPDAKFSTLQLKSKKTKSSSNAANSPRQFTSLFSPSAVLKRFTGSKNNETSNPESSIPPKYLKKYARSISVDNDSLFGAVSMPQLNSPKPGDSYSALGLYSENDRDSSLTLDDEAEVKRYFSGSQSALSLGAHSASMTSVYSAGACHYGYVPVSGDVLFGLNYNQKSQMMEVFVKQCRNLAAIDARHNKSNPYVKVYLLPDKTRSGKRKTKTKKNTVNPVFNELLRFPVLKNELESRTLWLSVWNSDLFGRNDFLGEISLPLGYRLLDSPTLRWYPLQERQVESLQSPLQSKGELFIALKYVPRDLSLESRFRPSHVISLRGALHVLVKEARNISAQGSTVDAFCKSYLLPDKSKTVKQKTPVVKKSGHPKWYYTVIYEDLSVDELKERSLELTVWDHDKIARNHFVGGVRLNIGTGLYHGVPVDWMDARRDESGLWLSMLDSPNMWVDGCLPLRPSMQTQGAGLYHS